MMSKIMQNIYKLRITKLLLCVIAAFCLTQEAAGQLYSPNYSTPENSGGSNYNQCQPSSSNGKWTTECPPGNEKRNDINPQCVRNQNKNSCVNTMPVKGSVARIPEDVCYRGTGWSNKRNHNGVDYAVPSGTPVTAAADGIAYVNGCNHGGGRVVKIVHKKSLSASQAAYSENSKNEYTTVYMHLSQINVSDGARVTKGQQIGLAGGSNCDGNGNIIENYYGSHLHFEMRDGNARNTNALPVLDPLCNSIQTLCEEKSTNPFYANQGQIDYDAMQCRDCSKNPQACEKTEEEPEEEKSEEQKKVDKAMASSDCVEMFPEDDMLMLSATGESGRDAGKTNWYKKYNGCYGNAPGTEGKDKGGCSYGANQMACGSTAGGKVSDGSFGNFRNFMTRLEKEKPELFAKLSQGNDLNTTIKYACNDQAYPEQNAAFRAAWEALGSDREFFDFQYTVNYDTYVGDTKRLVKNAGLNWDALSPEVQMTFVAADVAGPAMFKKMLSQLQEKYGKNLDTSDRNLIIDANNIRAGSYKNYLESGGEQTYLAVQGRAKEDIERTLLSAQLRDAIEQSKIAGSKYYGMSPDEIAIDMTGMRLCTEDEMGKTPNYDGSSSGSVVNSSATAAANQIAQEGGGSRDCSVSNYRNSFKSCIFCDIFRILFNTASTMAKAAYDTLVGGVINLVIVGTALWIAMTILSYISSFETKDPRNLAKILLNQGFIVIVVIIILSAGSNDFMSLILEPIFNTGMELGKLAISGDGGVTCNPDSTGGILSASDGGGLPPSMGVNILCLIDAIQGKILDIMAVGSSSICIAFYIKSWHHIVIFPHFGYLITGLLLWIGALLLLIIYPWLLVDALLQICVAVVLLPVAIGGYAFKTTRQMFVGKVWGTFLNAMFSFMFLSIVIAILIKALDDVTADAFDRSLVSTGDSGSAYEAIITGAKSIAWWTINLLKLVFIMLLGWAVLGEANKFAGRFSNGISTGGIGSQVGTLAASGARGVANKAGGVALSAAQKGGSMVKETVSEKYNDLKMANQNRKMRNRMEQAAEKGVDNGDGTMSYRNRWGRKFTVNKDGSGYSYKNLRGQTITKTTSTNENGKKVINITTTKKNGESTTVSNDGYIKSTVVKDKSGKITQQKTEMMAAAGKHLINKDGSVNQIALNNIMQNSGQDAETVKLAVMEQMIKERFAGLQVPDMSRSFRSRTLASGVDAQGRSTFSLAQQNTDGTTTNMSITFGENGRILTELETISAFRNNATKYSSDGIINRRSRYHYKNGEIDPKSVENAYSFTNYYHNLYGNGMNSLGQFANGIPSDQVMFSAEELGEFQEQIANTGTQTPLEGFK